MPDTQEEREQPQLTRVQVFLGIPQSELILYTCLKRFSLATVTFESEYSEAIQVSGIGRIPRLVVSRFASWEHQALDRLIDKNYFRFRTEAPVPVDDDGVVVSDLDRDKDKVADWTFINSSEQLKKQFSDPHNNRTIYKYIGFFATTPAGDHFLQEFETKNLTNWLLSGLRAHLPSTILAAGLGILGSVIGSCVTASLLKEPSKPVQLETVQVELIQTHAPEPTLSAPPTILPQDSANP